jgi:transporter family protein
MAIEPKSQSPAIKTRSGRFVPRWLWFTLWTLLLWGGWGLVSKPLSSALSAWQVQAFSSIAMIPVIGVLIRTGKKVSGTNSRRGLALAVGAGLLSSVGNVAYYQALSLGGKAAAVTPLTALYPLVTIGLALAFLRERINRIQVIGAVLSLAAMYCFNVGAGSEWLTPWLAVALLPIVLWGVGALLQKVATDQVSVEYATAAFLAGELPVAFLTPLLVKMQWNLPGTTWVLLLALGLFFGVGNLTLLYAYGSGGKAAIVTPLASLYSLVTIPLAVMLLGEHLSTREGLGIVLAVLAGLGLAMETRPSSSSS